VAEILTNLPQDFHSHLQGFTVFDNVNRGDQLLQIVARKQLTRSLSPITKPLIEECAYATAVVFGEIPEWSEVVLKNHVLDLVARMSSRVFLGPELCRDPRWLEVTKNYTVDAFIAADKLRLYPASLRWFLNYILPECKQPNIPDTHAGQQQDTKRKSEHTFGPLRRR
jgi:cytochrome P450 monooxygenase-2